MVMLFLPPPAPPLFAFLSVVDIICWVRSRKRSSMPRFSFADVWKWWAPTVRAYLKHKKAIHYTLKH